MNVVRPVVISLLAAALFTLRRCSDRAGATRKNDLDVVGARLRAMWRYRDSFIARQRAPTVPVGRVSWSGCIHVVRPVVISLLAAALSTLRSCSDLAAATCKNDLDVVEARLRAMRRYRDSFVARQRAPTVSVGRVSWSVCMNVVRPVVVSLLAAALFTLHRCSDRAGATRKNDLDVVGARLRAMRRYRDSFIARQRAPTVPMGRVFFGVNA
ncbi:hypothetical protein VDQ94_16035 [Xanthomonas campestris pv. campestris]|nr:hypothetical protein [Xanthomonas campestris pv. campestris]MEB1554935.1 hypothetical protein [Xanthomonas campestris pv. campestris]